MIAKQDSIQNGDQSTAGDSAEPEVAIDPKLLLRKYYAEYHKNLPVDPKLVLWESHAGGGMVCSPYAMFLYVVGRAEYAHLNHVWVIIDDVERARLEAEYAWASNVSFIPMGGPEYARCIATARYIIGNVSLPLPFSKREGQIIVNTWHSVTVKTLGFNQPNGYVASRNIFRSFVATDFLISPNPFMTQIYREGYRLDGVFHGQILETGFPRADLLAQTRREDILAKLAARGVVVDPNKKILLYAPTWRGVMSGKARAEVSLLEDFVANASARLDLSKYQILVRPHNVTYQLLKGDLSAYVPSFIDANELLAITDILVTDYSSIVYDFLPSGRPVLFYMPDLAAYEKERGLAIKPEELPGPVTADAGELADWVNDNCRAADAFAAKRTEQAHWAGPYDDGEASRRVVETVFSAKPRIRTEKPKSAKTRLLIYGGRFDLNGVTTTLITTLNALDYDRFDVTLYLVDSKEKLRSKLISWLPEAVRVVIRISTMSETDEEHDKVEGLLGGKYLGDAYLDPDVQAAFRREYIRCFGDMEFDYVIDYFGYSVMMPGMFAQARDAKSIIWQHNELARDFANAEKRSYSKAERSLPTVDAMGDMYQYLDKIVSCGGPVMELNRAAMSRPSTYDRFTYVTNMVDFERVALGITNRYCFPILPEGEKQKPKADRIDKADGKRHGRGYVYADVTATNKTGKSATATKIPLPEKGIISFVTMGRYSPEKNHRALISAFGRFCKETPNARLYLIGDGALRSIYEALIEELGLTDKVILTGLLKNPFGLASVCDCFILPSIYEGVGLVALEARLMSLPMVLSAFNAMDSVTVPGGQYMIETSEDSILDGLRAHVAGKVPPTEPFNAAAYNAAALREFYALFD